MNKYYSEFTILLSEIKNKEVLKEMINEYLVNLIDCEYIYESDDSLLSDVYFTLKHYAIGEEGITSEEIEYFLECLNGKKIHSFEDKMSIFK
jgi:hypothetical protein